MPRDRDVCAYCAMPFQPPDGPYNLDDEFSYPGWMIAFCSWDCAVLSDPYYIEIYGADGRGLS
jgi:hypothetical protein